jgi:predicted kinase
MRRARLIVVTGLPGTGKSTLAAQLAARFGVPLLAKDLIKEPLLDVLRAKDDRESRTLSDASFAVLFALASDSLARGLDLVIEGNFRPGEHERALRLSSAHVAQILCTIDEPTRLARLLARAKDPSRHPGHRDTALAARGAQPAADFLNLPGERWRYDSADRAEALASLFAALDPWWARSGRPI